MIFDTLLVALGFTLCAFAVGAHATVPWRLRRANPEACRPWALAAALLLSAGGLAYLALLGRFEDAVLGSGLVPFAASRLSLAFGVTAAALCLSDLLLLFAWRRLEQGAWPLLAIFGLATVVTQSFALAALAGGDGKAPAAALAVRAAVLVALALAASEAITSAAPRLAPVASLAGLVLPLFAFALPEAVREPFVSRGGLALLGLAAALLFSTRFVPRPTPRRALALAALLLAGFAWAKSVDIVGALAGQVPAVDAREVE